MIRIFALTLLFALAASQTLSDGYERGGRIDVTVLSAAASRRLFDQFAEASIPWGYPIEGCDARAMAMVRMADARNVQMAKIAVHGVLRAKTRNTAYPEVEWIAHTAPVAFVNTGSKTELMVFDPTLFDKPVPVEDWKNKLVSGKGSPEAKIIRSYYGSRFQYSPPEDEPKRSSWNRETLDASEALLRRLREMEKEPEARGQMDWDGPKEGER